MHLSEFKNALKNKIVFAEYLERLRLSKILLHSYWFPSSGCLLQKMGRRCLSFSFFTDMTDQVESYLLMWHAIRILRCTYICFFDLLSYTNGQRADTIQASTYVRWNFTEKVMMTDFNFNKFETNMTSKQIFIEPW